MDELTVKLLQQSAMMTRDLEKLDKRFDTLEARLLEIEKQMAYEKGADFGADLKKEVGSIGDIVDDMRRLDVKHSLEIQHIKSALEKKHIDVEKVPPAAIHLNVDASQNKQETDINTEGGTAMAGKNVGNRDIQE